MSTHRRARRCSAGFTLIELLVVIAIIGILLALLIPAVQAAREAARRSHCGNNLRQIGIGLHNYQDAYRSLPMAWWFTFRPNLNAGSWGTATLPYLEQESLYDQIDVRAPAVNELGPIGQKNVELIQTKLPLFVCPSVPGDSDRVYSGANTFLLPIGHVWLNLTWKAAPSDYCVSTGVRGAFANAAYNGEQVGTLHGALQVHGLYGDNRAGRLADIVDGQSQTVLIAERTGGDKIYSKLRVVPELSPRGAANGGGWGDVLNGEHWLAGSPHSGMTAPPQQGPCAINCTNLRGYGFHAFHPGGCHFLMADASVQFVSQTAAPLSIAGRITRDNGEVLPDE